MKYEEYVKKHEKILTPLNETMPLLNILSIIGMLGEEVGGKFGERVNDFCDTEKEILLNKEIKTVAEDKP